MTAVALESRDRWAMSVEARALVVLTAALTVFGLAFLYSASSIVAMQMDQPSWFFVTRQALGVCVGVVQSLSSYYIAPAFGQMFFFILFLLVMIFRPNGLLGQKGTANLGMN